ncbi:hypothetical protein R83H12_02366 [Fibrobacteria bacterium R8-3-H12]
MSEIDIKEYRRFFIEQNKEKPSVCDNFLYS